MATEDDVKKNRADIHTLTVNVTRLATIVENAEKRHDTDMEVMKEAIRGISRLNERIGATVGMEKDIAGIRDTLAEQKGDIRTIRHDLNNALNAITGIAIVSEKLNEATAALAAQGAKVEGLESWRDRLDGSGVAGLAKRVDDLERRDSRRDGAMGALASGARTFWSVFDTPVWVAATAVGVWLLTQMFGRGGG